MQKPQQPASTEMQHAAVLFQRGQLGDAETLCRRVLAAMPGRFDALHILGTIASRQGNYEEAARLLKLALLQVPNSEHVLSELAFVLAALDRYEEALMTCARGLVGNPNFAPALHCRGIALYGLGRPSEALASYDKALKINPHHPQALNDRGKVLVSLGRHGDALASYDRALAIKPDYAEAWYNRGSLLERLDRREEARDSYRRALSITPDYRRLRRGRDKRSVAPEKIRIEASSFCQLRCPSCPTTAGAIHPAIGRGFLRFDDFRRLIDENPSVASVELSNYGEALLNPHLLRILEYAHAKEVTITISNGVNLNTATDELLEGIVKYRVFHVTCSIDGATPETYRTYRVRGEFKNVIRNIERINHFKQLHGSEYPILTWQFVVFGHNEREIPIAHDMAAKLGMSFATKISWDPEFSPVRDKEFVRTQTGERAVTRAEYEQIHGKSYVDSICHQLWDHPQFNWDGKNLGCCRNFWGEFGGNALTDGVAAALDHEKMAYARDMLRGRKPPREDIPCSTCEMYHAMQSRSEWIVRDDG